MDAVLLTFKHKPSNPEERKRIESLGGTVVFGRLFGDLAVSRAFGDRDYKKPVWEVDYVSCDPYLVRSLPSFLPRTSFTYLFWLTHGAHYSR